MDWFFSPRADISAETLNILYLYYGNLERASGLFTCLGIVTKVKLFQTVTGFFSLLVFEFCILVTSFYTYDNVEAFVENLHVAILVTISVLSVISIRVGSPSFLKFHAHAAEGYFTYEGPVEGEEAIRSRGRLIRLLWTNYFPLFMLFLFFFLTIFGPIINYAFPPRSNGDNHVNNLLPLAMWTPFDSSSGFPFWAAFLLQSFFIGYAIAVLVATNAVFICGAEDLCTQLSILRYALKSLQDRAILYSKSSELTTIKDSLHICFKNNIKHHILILECWTYFHHVSSGVMFYMFLSGGVMLAADVLLLIQKGTSIVTLIRTILYMITEGIVFITLCWYGERFKTLAAGVEKELYNHEWHLWTKEMRNSALIMFEVLKRPLIFKAGGVIPATLETFSNILNAGYSSFNMITAFK